MTTTDPITVPAGGYDVIVIGAGPAGEVLAGRCAERRPVAAGEGSPAVTLTDRRISGDGRPDPRGATAPRPCVGGLRLAHDSA